MGEPMVEGAEEAEAADVEREAQLKQRRLDRAGLPAIYVDAWSITWWNSLLRLSLAERLYGNLNYRFVALLELNDAESLGKHLLQLVEAAKAELIAQEATPEQESELETSDRLVEESLSSIQSESL